MCGLLQQHTITVRKQREHTNTVRLLQTPTWSHYSDCNNSVLQISRWSEKCKTKCGRWTGFIVRKASAEQLFSWHCPFRALKRSFHDVLLSLQMFSFRPPRVFYVENLPNRAKIPRNLTAVLVFHVSCCMKGKLAKCQHHVRRFSKIVSCPIVVYIRTGLKGQFRNKVCSTLKEKTHSCNIISPS